MPLTLTEKLIHGHLRRGTPERGAAIGLGIDQTLTQDATGTLVMLELEALGLDRVRTQVSAQYVDHNLLQTDEKNADDHLFLESACRRFGIWFSRPGNGVSHPLHMQRFGRPGATLVGSDSHTPAAGALGMLAIGAGGLQVATAMAGHPLPLTMPGVFGVRLEGRLPDWVSAKDVILEMLRRHGVDGAQRMVIEYHGPGLDGLSAMDRHVIANMGTELGATSTVFPADREVARYLESEGRGEDFTALVADEGAAFDRQDTIDLGALEPLIALPSSPDRVVPVREVAGRPIYQAYLGSSANPGHRDFAVPAAMVAGRTVPDTVSLDVNPTSRQLYDQLAADGSLERLLAAGARLHQTGCNGCIGMGQAPASGRNSLRTVPRNFPGRSGTREDSVYLCSPETATASALAGCITDPRDMAMDCPRPDPPTRSRAFHDLLEAPLPPERAIEVRIVRPGHVEALPEFDALPDSIELPVLLDLGDHVSTDEILPAGTRALPYRSSIPEISRFAFDQVAPDYAGEAAACRDEAGTGHAIVAGRNFGQGSSREHAVVATRYLGMRVVLARSIARIFHQNLINFGVLPLIVADPDRHARLARGDRIAIEGLREALRGDGRHVTVSVNGGDWRFDCRLPENRRARDLLLAGGLIPDLKGTGDAAARSHDR